MKILIFGGTTEGRMLCEFCSHNSIYADVCVATEYGETVLGKSDFVSILTGRKDREAIRSLTENNNYAAVFDATHPYAAIVSENVREVCRENGTVYHRVKRTESEFCENAVYCDSAQKAAEYLSERSGEIFISTGSKEIECFSSLADRSVVRILPLEENIRKTEKLGFRKLITAVGPFTEEENIRDFGSADFVVTKESGKTGGFPEKVSAAEKLGCQLVIIRRPMENGISLEEAYTKLLELKK